MTLEDVRCKACRLYVAETKRKEAERKRKQKLRRDAIMHRPPCRVCWKVGRCAHEAYR